MAYNNLSSLTPSRPAPTPPLRPGGNNLGSSRSAAGSASSSRASPSLSSAYGPSYPILNPSSALGPQPLASNKNVTVRTGQASVKEEGLRSFMWSKRWLVLGGLDLQIFKNEVRAASVVTDMWWLGREVERRGLTVAIFVTGVYLSSRRSRRCTAGRS
jgi:hypothetical protein